MRHRSLTNNNRETNDVLSNDYRDNNKCDEIAYLFPAWDHAFVRVPGSPPWLILEYDQPACDLHHITGGILGTPRWDITTNLISLCRHTHLFCEGEHAHDGLVLCLRAKQRKGELDWNELDRITHTNFRGWVEIQDLKLDWVRPIRDALLQERQAIFRTILDERTR